MTRVLAGSVFGILLVATMGQWIWLAVAAGVIAGLVWFGTARRKACGK